MNPWDEPHNPLDARAWPTTPPPEPDFLPPPPPPMPVIHTGVYADLTLQARAGVQPGMSWVEGQNLMDQQLAADRAQQSVQTLLQPPPLPAAVASSAAPASARADRPPTQPAAVPDLTLSSLQEARAAVHEYQQAWHDRHRAWARPWRQAALALWALTLPVAWALPSLWPRAAAHLGGLPALLLGVGVLAAAVGVWRRWAPDAELRTLRRLSVWLARLDPDLLARVPSPDEARFLAQQAQGAGLNLRLRLFAWQVPRQSGRAHPVGLVLEAPPVQLGWPPHAECATEQHPRPRPGVDHFLDRVERNARRV